MPTQTGFWIQVKNGEIKQVWDYQPSAEKLATEGGWREAVEIRPDIVAGREVITTHSFNIEVSPAQIVWSKRDVTVDERKASLIAGEKAKYQAVVREQADLEVNDNAEDVYDAEAVAAAKATRDANIAAIEAAADHDALDAL